MANEPNVRSAAAANRLEGARRDRSNVVPLVSDKGSGTPAPSSSAASDPRCVCAEINMRHCPVHGQGEAAATSDECELLGKVLDRILLDRDKPASVVRWTELAQAINEGAADEFPNEIREALS